MKKSGSGGWSAAAIGAGMLACALATSASAACKFVEITELPITMDGLRATVPTKIDGQDARFVLDTGAWYSMLAPAAAEQLKIRGDRGKILIGGVSGEETVSVGLVHEFRMAGATWKDAEFLIGHEDFGAKSVGLLGENLALSRYDVEYDMANGALRFFKADGCETADLAYWTKPGTSNLVPVTMPEKRNPKIVGTATINGKTVRVLFDTGSSLSILTLNAARRIGIDINASKVENGGIEHGIGNRLLESWVVPIDSFQLGSEQVKNTRIRVSRMDLRDGDMLLGLDFFLSHRILVSNTLHKLFLTYNGGPVFRLDAADTKTIAAKSSAPPPSVHNQTAEPAMDAAAYARRAAASLSRRDLKAAIADYGKAIELEPSNAVYFDRRGLAYGEDDQLRLALADFDQALKLKPDDVEALFSRGSAHVGLKEDDAGMRDFAAAAIAAPDNEVVRLSISNFYLRHQKFPEAIAEIDALLAARTKFDEVWQALNSRCWTRAMWGRELDKALDDCNAALKKGGRSSQVLDSRGMVYLRRGEYAEAVKDYDAVLKLQPKMPGSLIGRGLARQELGDAAGAKADLDAGTMLSPATLKELKKFGVIDASGKLARPTTVASGH